MTNSFTPKQRMLNAYQGIFSDRYPVAPEFWCYYPARVLGVDMIELERDIPLWRALQTTFRKYGTEGWCAYYSWPPHPEVTSREKSIAQSDGRFLLTQEVEFKGRIFTVKRMYDKAEPSWQVEYPVRYPAEDLEYIMDMSLPETMEIDVESAIDAYNEVNENYLLEFSIGNTFFDMVAGLMGFETGVMYFMDEDNRNTLCYYQQKYMEFLKAYIDKACKLLPYESYFVGCAWASNSLEGASLWRKWDKPVLKLIADELHRHGKLLHIHLHGRCIETAADLVEIGVDCVCPFERPPGGDVTDLRELREILDGKVTMNGNVHTVETLIRGTCDDVRREVREIIDAFAGGSRLVVGTGDQVGGETPEENIHAMVDEVKRMRFV